VLGLLAARTRACRWGIGAAPQTAPRLAVADAALLELHGRSLPAANCDFAVATLTGVCEMAPGSAEAIFAVARTAGWLAHALEEYSRRKPLAPRTHYFGPARSERAGTRHRGHGRGGMGERELEHSSRTPDGHTPRSVTSSAALSSARAGVVRHRRA
jgi:hypothetical protein